MRVARGTSCRRSRATRKSERRKTPFSCFFFFNDTATTEIYTLSLHDALPISAEPPDGPRGDWFPPLPSLQVVNEAGGRIIDRKSTRLNSSHLVISYAVFCLKKKKRDRCRDRYQSATEDRWSSHQ